MTESEELTERLLEALKGHDSEGCIDREAPRYCSGLYWILWQCHEERISEATIRESWHDFPGYPRWSHRRPMMGPTCQTCSDSGCGDCL